MKQEILNLYPNIKVYAKECKLNEEESRKNFYNFIKENDLHPDMLINNAGYILEGSVLGTNLTEINRTK